MAQGPDPVLTDIQKANNKMKRNFLKEEFKEKYVIDTADSIQQYSYQNPRMLRWLFDHERETKEEETETQRRLIQEFELRKLDMKYFAMLEKGQKAHFLAERNAKSKA